jgi:hypothetical protein
VDASWLDLDHSHACCPLPSTQSSQPQPQLPIATIEIPGRIWTNYNGGQMERALRPRCTPHCMNSWTLNDVKNQEQRSGVANGQGLTTRYPPEASMTTGTSARGPGHGHDTHTQYSFLSSSAIPYDTVTIPITVTSNLVNMIRECRQLLMRLSHLTSLRRLSFMDNVMRLRHQHDKPAPSRCPPFFTFHLNQKQ